MQEALTHIQTSLEQLEKKGRQSPKHVRSDACRLKTIVSLHEEKHEVLSQIRNMREWVMEVEHSFDGSGRAKQKRSAMQKCGGDWTHGWLVSPPSWKQMCEQKTSNFVEVTCGSVMTHLSPG